MSRRNRPVDKKLRKLERAIRKGRVATNVDLIYWLKQQGHAQTTGEARQIILDERVMSESHPVGFVRIGTQKILSPAIPSSKRETLRVKAAA